MMIFLNKRILTSGFSLTLLLLGTSAFAFDPLADRHSEEPFSASRHLAPSHQNPDRDDEEFNPAIGNFAPLDKLLFFQIVARLDPISYLSLSEASGSLHNLLNDRPNVLKVVTPYQEECPALLTLIKDPESSPYASLRFIVRKQILTWDKGSCRSENAEDFLPQLGTAKLRTITAYNWHSLLVGMDHYYRTRILRELMPLSLEHVQTFAPVIAANADFILTIGKPDKRSYTITDLTQFSPEQMKAYIASEEHLSVKDLNSLCRPCVIKTFALLDPEKISTVAESAKNLLTENMTDEDITEIILQQANQLVEDMNE